MFGRDQTSKSGDKQDVLLEGGLMFLRRESLRGFEHRRAGCPSGVVPREFGTVRLESLHLRNGVETAALVELDIDMAERLQAGTDSTGGLTHPPRYASNPTMLAGEQGDDAVGFAQLLGAKDDGFIPVRGHRPLSLTPRSQASFHADRFRGMMLI